MRVGVLHPDYATRQEPADTVLVATTVRLKETEMPLFETQSKVDKEELLLFMSDISGKENTVSPVVVEATDEENVSTEGEAACGENVPVAATRRQVEEDFLHKARADVPDEVLRLRARDAETYVKKARWVLRTVQNVKSEKPKSAEPTHIQCRSSIEDVL